MLQGRASAWPARMCRNEVLCVLFIHIGEDVKDPVVMLSDVHVCKSRVDCRVRVYYQPQRTQTHTFTLFIVTHAYRSQYRWRSLRICRWHVVSARHERTAGKLHDRAETMGRVWCCDAGGWRGRTVPRKS